LRNYKLSTKSILLLSLVLIMALALVLAGCNSNTDGDIEAVELNLAHFFPATHPAETELVQGWAAAVEEATDGKVKIVSYPGETLSKAPDIYNNVVEGAADLGLGVFAYNAGRFPTVEAFEQPGVIYENSKVASMVAWNGLQELDPVELQDTQMMMVIATGPGDLFTKEPVNTLEDIQGMQIRATGLSAKTLELIGATPVAMPQSEAYESLSKGVVDGNLAPVEVLKAWNHAEVTDYITQTPFLYNTLFYITMNLDVWNSLDEQTQQAITDATATFFEATAIGLWDRQNEEALAWAVDEQGMELITLTEEEAANWISLVEPMQDTYIEEKGEAGEQALEVVNRLADQYNEEY
jgi:TRAP-type transport system periplasmic protein